MRIVMIADQQQRVAAREQRIIYELGKLIASDLDIYEVENPDGMFPPSATPANRPFDSAESRCY